MADDPPIPMPVRGPTSAEARFNVALSIVSLLAVVIMVNYLALRHPRVLSLSDAHYQQLSPVTTQVLGMITNDIDVILFFDRSSPLYSLSESLLLQYRDANPRIRVKTIDYNVKRPEAEEIKARYKLGANVKDSVIFSNGRDHKIIPQGHLSQYNTDDLVSGRTKSVKRMGFNGEAHFTSALVAVSRVEDPYVAFITGYGDYHNPTNISAGVGYSEFSNLLRRHHTKVGAIHLPSVAEIPRSVKAVVLPGLGGNVPDRDQEKLNRYLEAGGRMLVMFRLNAQSGLERMLYDWGVEVENKLVIDADQRTSGGALQLSPVDYASHPIMRPLRQAKISVVMSPPRPVRSTASNQAADAPQVLELMRTGLRGHEVTDYLNQRRVEGDRSGHIPVAAVVEKGGIQGVTGGSTRIVVLGDSLCFANNNLMQVGNYDLAWNIVSWLLDRSEMLGIAPQPVTEYQFSLTRKQSTNLSLIFLAGIPGGILFFGWLVWLRRQS